MTIKQKPAEKIYKTFPIERKLIDVDEGIYEIWISTESIDRDGDVVVADGALIDNYLKNPVVLFGHSYRDPNAIVGKSLEIEKVSGKGVKSRFQFAPAGISPGADTTRRLWEAELLNAASIGFRPRKWTYIDAEGQLIDSDSVEERQNARGYRFDEWELLEWSIVTVPANQDALRNMIKDWDGDEYDRVMGALFPKEVDPPELSDMMLDEDTGSDAVIETETEEETSPPTNDDPNELTDEDATALGQAVNQLRESLPEIRNVLVPTKEDN